MRWQHVTVVSRDVVLQFLSHLFTVRQRALATANVAMAALKDSLSAAFGISLEGRDVDLLLRLFFLQRPPEKGRCPFWFLQKVLDLLSSPTFGKLSMPRQLLTKALFILTMASGLRSSQIHALICYEAWTVFAEDRSKMSLAPNPVFLQRMSLRLINLIQLSFRLGSSTVLLISSVLWRHCSVIFRLRGRPLETNCLCGQTICALAPRLGWPDAYAS